MSSRKEMKSRAAPHLAHPEAPVDLERQARDRYAELVEKKYASALSAVEQAEMLRLQVYLDQAEARFYEPIERKLKSALMKLRHEAKR